jgi:phosphatidylethanolamine-binding protein (PEBP) family uncharacterized protein
MLRDQGIAPIHSTTGTHHGWIPLPALMLLLLGVLAAATGCGESNTTTTAASAATTAAAKTGSSSTAPSSPASAGSSSSKGASAPSSAGGSSSVSSSTGHSTTDRSKAHLVLPPPGSHPAPKLSASERETLPLSDIPLRSPAIAPVSGSSISAQYTCHGTNSSPPLQWSGIPSDTKELALLVMSSTPVNGQLFFDWAIAGLSPTLTGLQAGKLPPGAVTGRSSTGHAGYSICPPTGKRESYVFMLYALPHSLSPKPSFDPASLRKEAMRVAHHTGLLVGNYG